MTTISSRASHGFNLSFWWNYQTQANEPRVYGASSWDMPDGNGLRREMRRSTELRSPAEIRRWARKYSDVSEVDIQKAIEHLLGR